jgi:hypothetical protein
VRLTQLEYRLFNALTVLGHTPEEAQAAVSAAVMQCLPSYQALLTLAREAAADARKTDDEILELIAVERPDDISF